MNKKPLEGKGPSLIRILIADDMLLGRLAGRQLFTQLGFTKVELVQSGVEAWNLLENAQQGSEPFDLLLSDWMMPDINGLELIQKLKDVQWKYLPAIVMVTAESDLEEVQKALQTGIAGYIQKPLSKGELLPVLKIIG
jgi:CheY-like chemotaxis protein